MSPTATPLDELDLEISVAWIALGGARGLLERCPSGENEGRVAAAGAELDRLLDLRLTTQAA